MSWFDTYAPEPSNRLPLNRETFLTRFAPAMICYYTMAVLVLLRHTLYIRMAFLPISLWIAFRAATTIDVTLGYDVSGLSHLNFGLCLGLFYVCMRLIEWTLCREPFKRTSIIHQGKDDVTRSSLSDRALTVVFWDAFDLCLNLRGLGWDWSTGLHIPVETRPAASRKAFVIATFISMTRYYVAADFLLYFIQHLPPYMGNTIGGTIFDPTLSPLRRYVRSSLITYTIFAIVEFGIQTFYHICTLVGVLIFQQAPHQWPPIFDKPWRSTSCTGFWAKRWHQSFRSSFVTLGAIPLNSCFGRVGGVLGAFLVSGIYHDLTTWSLGMGIEPWSVTGSFLMMGVGVILEHVWRKVTGVRVGGPTGWVWCHAWGIIWMQPLIEAWFRRGAFDGKYLPEHLRPSRIVAGDRISEFAAWIQKLLQ